MDLWQAFLLGLVEGLTEYLPVSSTGHLLVVQRLLGIEQGEAANAYAIVIQAGAIIAVLGLYRQRVLQMVVGLRGRDEDGRRIATALGVAFLPAAIFGLLADDAIEAYLFGIWPIVAAWAAGGLLILALSPWIRSKKGQLLETLSLRAAFLVGLAQCAAMWPGVSRSLATILGGLAVGLSLTAAVEFSFLLGLITLGAATAYKGLDSGAAMLDAYGPTELAVGFLAAWISAILAVKWMVAWLNRRGLEVFGWWRIGTALAVGGLALSGWFDVSVSPDLEEDHRAPAIEETRTWRLDPHLRATLDALKPLAYTSGARLEDDVPGHVRGASAIRNRDGRSIILQDDVNALAVRYSDGRTEPLLLPLGPDGRRVFDGTLGNKALKLDLEACAQMPDGTVIAFGSGSNAHRERLVLLSRDDEVSVRQAHAFYQHLRRTSGFAGSELNVEGALVVGDELLLFQRGNGSVREGLGAVNAVGVVALPAFLTWLEDGGATPSLIRVVPVELGSIAGVQLGFTDAALTPDGRVAIIACAEASANVIEDGAVVGCRFGFLEADGLWMTDIVDASGRLATTKIEGLDAQLGSPGTFDVVTDADDPAIAAMWGRLSVSGGPVAQR